MQVRLKTGRYAGELQDVRPDCARQMIADGRASDPRLEGGFACGGLVPEGTPFTVGESCHGSFLPRAVVDKFEATIAKVAKSKKGRS
jgi:hypothetical protein